MAKGNLFLGMGRGKVGDVVFYRMNGFQMARVRNRTPKNPRSNEQLYQRAVIATVMKAYSMGKEIFDHSFQTYTVGEGCMRRFNSLNARILRQQLATEVNTPNYNEGYIARFVAPRSVSPTPLIGMQVSEGTLDQNLFIPEKKGDGYIWNVAPRTDDELAPSYFGRLGISSGDIFTFLFIMTNKNELVYKNPWHVDDYSNQYNTKFAWVRLIVKTPIPDIIGPGGTAPIYKFFDIETGGNLNINFNINQNFHAGEELPFTMPSGWEMGVTACIRSRDDVDLRSTEFTRVYGNNAFGIASPYVLEVWQNEVQKIGQSELILEGGDGLATFNAETNTPIVDSPAIESDLTPRGRRKA